MNMGVIIIHMTLVMLILVFPKLPEFDENIDQMDSGLERFESFAKAQRW